VPRSGVDFKHALHDRMSPLHGPQVKQPSNLAKSRMLLKRSAPQVYPVESNSPSKTGLTCVSHYSITPKPQLPALLFHRGESGPQVKRSLRTALVPLSRYFYLISRRILSAQNSLLTFPNSFNTLPMAETVSCARSELLFYIPFHALPVLRP